MASEGIKKFRREQCLNPNLSTCDVDRLVKFESDWALLYSNEHDLFRVEGVLEKRGLGKATPAYSE